MKIIKNDNSISEREKRQTIDKIAKEKQKERTLTTFKKSDAYKIVMLIINEEIEKAADVRNIPSDARNLTETAKLLIINQRALTVLENIKKRIEA